MPQSSPANLSAADRPIAVCARHDLELVPVAYSGQSAYVVKDPLTLELFHLTAEEHFLLQALRQPTSLGQLRRDFERQFAPRRITLQALGSGIDRLYSQGLLFSEAHGQGGQLYRRGQRHARGERLQSMMSLLALRVGSVDATRVVDGLHARLGWLYSLPVLVGVVAAMLYAASILLWQPRELLARLPSMHELAQPRYWLLWLATIAVVKVIHELAHAVTCKHFGGRCHEIGILLLACVPCLYCDVSDIWRLPSKWQRIAVSAAGMIVECVIAAVALAAWWHTQPGLLHTWCLSLVVVCSVGTLLVNANPLLRYDGYYILADLVEVPNLAGRSRGLLPTAMQSWLLGQPRPEDPLLSPRKRRALIFYAVAARVYLTIVLLSIFAILLTWARPHHLENVVYTLIVVTLVGLLVGPATALWRMLRNPAVRARLRRLRAAAAVAALGGAAAAIFFWPIASAVRGPVVLVPADGQAVYATTAGELRHALAPGTAVVAGDVVARLANSDLDLQLAKQNGEYQVQRVNFQQLGAMRAWDATASTRLPTARAARDDAQSQLAEHRRQAAQLTLTAPISGAVIAPPDHTLSTPPDEKLPTWTGQLLDERNLGCWVEPGTVVCMIGDPTRLSALVAVDQADVPDVRIGQTVEILLDSVSVDVVKGEVVQVTRRGTDRASTDSTDVGKYHLVEVRLDEQDSRWLVGARGQGKIAASHTTLGRLAANQLRRLLRLPW